MTTSQAASATATEDKQKIEPNLLLESAANLVAPEMQQVNKIIQDRLDSDIALIRTLGAYIIKSGGKRLRPMILLLCARACNYHGKDHTILAAVIEFIHTATLLHDDVVDDSALRRGQPTANEVWGNEASVLVGDFLYSRSFEMMVETNNMAVMGILASTTNSIAEGEVMQLLNAHSPDTTEQAYLLTIHRKTAKLFESAAWLAGVISEQNETTCKALANYGTHLGSAFQMVDDILDYDASSKEIGKNVGDDLAEGKPTLPLIQAMKVGNQSQTNLIRQAIENGERKRMPEVLEIVHSTGAIKYTSEKAQQQADAAIESIQILPDSPSRQALIYLAEFSILRQH